MRMSRLFGRTLRDPPSDADAISHQFLVRGGYIRQLGSGIFNYLHLARRAMAKIERILREEMDAIGGQEITMPVVHPADLWQESGRWYQIGSEMGRFRDKNEHDMVLAMTHEEVVADLVRSEILSYKDLPRLVYHIQTKWRDDPRPRGGLLRVREFTMKDSYSLDADWEGLEAQYRAHYQAYFNIFNRCGLPVIAVQSDVGMMGGKVAHEYMYLHSVGEDTILVCPACDYVANRQVARFKKAVPSPERARAVEKVATPGVTSIADLSAFLDVPESRTAKAVLMVAKVVENQAEVERFVFAVLRGDTDLSDTKLANAVQAKSLRPAQEEEIRGVGAVPGYASPIGVREALIVVDDLIPDSPNLVAGANQEGYHLLNVNYGRDYQATVVADIAVAEDGAPCPVCGTAMQARRGVEVGNIFQLGSRYSDSLGCTFLDSEGKRRPVLMGSYGIGVGRLLACIVEEHHDEHGPIWPISVAPYPVHIVDLKGGQEVAERLYQELWSNEIEALYDDRNESAGVRFSDADLIGAPIRVTVSSRSLEGGGIEVKRRAESERFIIPLKESVEWLEAEVANLQAAILERLHPVPYIG